MANFTAQEANACVITKCTSLKIDGVHQQWHIMVVDDNNYTYEVSDDLLPGDADETAVKNAIRVKLMDTEKLPAPPVKTQDDFDDVVGDTVG